MTDADKLPLVNIVAQRQIDAIAELCAVKNPIVVVWSLVYNHGPFLHDYFRGVLMQQTDFPFVVIVHDDASTDNSAAIIREYAEKYSDIILPIFESENQYSKRDGSLDRIMNEACKATGAKYIAMCEGDDYWIAPLKLQKQVDFLDSHPCCLLTYTKCVRLNNMNNSTIDFWGGPSVLFKDLVMLNTIPTLTTLFRTAVYMDYYKEINPNNQDWMMGDYPMWLYFSLEGDIYFFNENTSVYRVLDNSASHSPNKLKKLIFKESCNEVSIFFLSRQSGCNYREILDNKLALRLQLKYQKTALLQGGQSVSRMKILKEAFKAPMNVKQRIKLIILSVLPNSLSNMAFL